MSGTPYAEVIGDPIAQSKSPLIHKFWLDALGIAGDYRRAHIKADELAAFIDQRRADPDWRGCNVTIPHKVAVMDLVDDPGNIRGTIGAMNTIVRQPDGSVIGTNTDAAGFYAPLAELDLEGAPVVVDRRGRRGARGAVRAGARRCRPCDHPQSQPAQSDGPARNLRPEGRGAWSRRASCRPPRCSSIRAASA